MTWFDAISDVAFTFLSRGPWNIPRFVEDVSHSLLRWLYVCVCIYIYNYTLFSFQAFEGSIPCSTLACKQIRGPGNPEAN